MPITDDKAKEIHLAKSFDEYSYEELREADQWLKRYAIACLNRKLDRGIPAIYTSYLMHMAQATFKDWETQKFLAALNCFPDWFPKR